MLPASSLMLLFPLLGSGAQTDLAAGVAVEESAGLVGLEFDQPSTPASTTTLTLSAGLRRISHSSELVVRYSPSWFLQVPNTQDTFRPLLMHRLSGTHGWLLSPRLGVVSELVGGIGDMGYSNLPPELANNSGTIRTDFVSLAYVNATSDLGYRLTKLHTLGVGLAGGVRSPLDDSGSFTPSYNAALSLSDAYAISRIDSLRFQVRGGYIGIIGEPVILPPAQDLVALGGNVGWDHELDETSDLAMSAGAAFTYLRDSETLALLPLASVAHTQRFGSRGWQWSNLTSTGIQGTFNDFSATYLPQAFINWSLSGSYARDWTFGLNLDGRTNLTGQPLVPDEYETLVTFSQPTTYRLTHNASLSFGVRAGIRAAHISEIASLDPQVECTGFLGLSYALGTDPSRGNWLR